MYLLRVCQIGQILAVLALLLLAAAVGFVLAPQGQEGFYAVVCAALTGGFLAVDAWRDNVAEKHRNPSSF